MFLVIIFIVYFDYMLSIVGLSTYSCISSYSSHFGVHGVSGKHCVSMVLICCLPVNAPYILSHVVCVSLCTLAIYIRGVDYKGLNKSVTHAIYHMAQNTGWIRR